MINPTPEQIWLALRVLFGKEIRGASLTILLRDDVGVQFESFFFPADLENEAEK